MDVGLKCNEENVCVGVLEGYGVVVREVDTHAMYVSPNVSRPNDDICLSGEHQPVGTAEGEDLGVEQLRGIFLTRIWFPSSESVEGFIL